MQTCTVSHGNSAHAPTPGLPAKKWPGNGATNIPAAHTEGCRLSPPSRALPIAHVVHVRMARETTAANPGRQRDRKNISLYIQKIAPDVRLGGLAPARPFSGRGETAQTGNEANTVSPGPYYF